MAFTEYAVINPRRRRHKRRRRRGVARTTRRRRRRRSLVAYNPRPRRRRLHRRRRYSARRSHRRRRRSNPRGLSLGSGNVVKVLTHAGALVAGAAVAEIATGFIAQYVPKGKDGKTPVISTPILVGAVGLIGLPLLLRMTPLRRFAPTVALGTAFIVGWDLYNIYVKPNLPLHGLGIYGSDEGGLNGLGVYGGGITGQGIAGLGWGEDSMYADSMYT